MSKSYVAILLVVLVAALLGMAIAQDPGYMLIAWRHFSIETSIWVGLGFLLAFWLLLMLTRTLLQGKRTRWQQSPFLLTANKPVEDEDDEKKGNL